MERLGKVVLALGRGVSYLLLVLLPMTLAGDLLNSLFAWELHFYFSKGLIDMTK